MNFSKKTGTAGVLNKYDFVDIELDQDNKLFIDPVLLRMSKRKICRRMVRVMDDFFDSFYKAYRTNNRKQKLKVLSHANEVNATRLGYGSGDNGTGNTVAGLLKKFKEFDQLSKISTISLAEDLVLFTRDFAEDGLSDLLTNIIQKELYDYTDEVYKENKIEYNDQSSFWSWNYKTHEWVHYENAPTYNPGNGRVLLVPNEIVSKTYLFSISNYLWKELLERAKKERTVVVNGSEIIPNKKDIYQDIITKEGIKERDAVLRDINKKPDYLASYHDHLIGYYRNRKFDESRLEQVLYKGKGSN